MSSRFLFRALLGLGLLGLVAPGSVFAAGPGSEGQGKRWAKGRILVQPAAGLDETEFDGILKKHGGRALGKIKQIQVHVVEVPPQAEDAVAKALAKNAHVKFAEKDFLVSLEGTADDPRFGSQWHLSKIGAPSAWDTSGGGGVVVAVLDTGVNGNHEDLAAKMVPGRNIYDNNDNTSDVYGHGTWVAGVVAAETNNGLGVASVACDALIMPVRISQPDGYAYWSTVASGITWAADHGARVANVSYNGVSGSASVQSAARYMRNKGGLVVVAAGNSGGLESISESPDLITVSATGSNDTRASFSSYGAYVDVAAPGTSIVTTSSNGGYSTVQGTSFSSPCTAGVVAMIMAANPSLAPSQVEEILFQTALDIGSGGWDQYYGFGRVDAAAAVAAAAGTEGQDTQRPFLSITSPTGGTVSGTVPVHVTASDNVGVTRVDLYVNGSFHASDETEPYQFSWDSTQISDGPADLVAYAYDAVENEDTSNTVDVTVDNVPDPVDEAPPTAAVTSPVDGAAVSGRVRINVSANDDVGITLLEVLVDGTALCANNATTLSCVWNTRKAASGTHSISGRARDAAGNVQTTSTQVTVGGSGSRDGGSKGKGKKK